MELCPIHGPTPPHHPVVMNDHDLVWKHTKTRCRAFEGALAVVTFQTFYRGDHKTLKNETLASVAISSSSSSPSSSSHHHRHHHHHIIII